MVLHLIKLEFPSPEDVLRQIWWKLAQFGREEEDFLISSMYFRYFVNISPWKRVGYLFKKLESPSPKDTLCQVWLKFLEKDFFYFVNEILTIGLLSPLGKGQDPSFEHIGIPFTQGCIVPILVENGQVVLEMFCFVHQCVFAFW